MRVKLVGLKEPTWSEMVEGQCVSRVGKAVQTRLKLQKSSSFQR